jgi:ketosteroid isomerase-like protein
VLEHIREEAHGVEIVPFFAGLAAREPDALVRSFAGEPELHHPIRGRVRGVGAFERFAAEMSAWLAERNVALGDARYLITARRGIEEVVVALDGKDGRIELPIAIAADHVRGGRIAELRMYFSSWPLSGSHAVRPPLLQPDPRAREADVVGEYQDALASGDADAAVAAFEPDGYVREPAGDGFLHRGTDELRALYELFFSVGGGIALEHCSVTDDGRACAVEYNVVRWGRALLPPQAGIAVYVRGASGKLAAARIYDDCKPPFSA